MNKHFYFKANVIFMNGSLHFSSPQPYQTNVHQHPFPVIPLIAMNVDVFILFCLMHVFSIISHLHKQLCLPNAMKLIKQSKNTPKQKAVKAKSIQKSKILRFCFPNTSSTQVCVAEQPPSLTALSPGSQALGSRHSQLPIRFFQNQVTNWKSQP